MKWRRSEYTLKPSFGGAQTNNNFPYKTFRTCLVENFGDSQNSKLFFKQNSCVWFKFWQLFMTHEKSRFLQNKLFTYYAK